MKKYFSLLLAILIVFGCSPKIDLEEEMLLAIKAGKETLVPEELAELKDKNHPILMQLGDPLTKKMLGLFANLPITLHNDLLKNGYLKWKYSELDEGRKQFYKEYIQYNVELAKKQGQQADYNVAYKALWSSEVGFAVVNVDKQKIISWYILWPQGDPTWVTVAGAQLCGTQEYFQAHLKELPLLKGMPTSALP